MSRLIVVEFAAHAHVVPPWILSSRSKAKFVLVPRLVGRPVKEHLENYEVYPEIRILENERFFLLFLLKNRLQKKCSIVVSSLPEARTSLRNSLLVLALAVTGCDILCIRNSRCWILSERVKWSPQAFTSKVKTKILILDILSFFFEKLLLFRSRQLVFEFEFQKDAFQSHTRISSKKPLLVFPGRLPLEKRSKIQIESRHETRNSVIAIGILGSINPKRRDYDLLFEAMSNLEATGSQPAIYFIGAYVGVESQVQIDRFAKWIVSTPSREEPYVSDVEYRCLAQVLDVLVAPMSPDWNYENGMSTGSVADSIYLQKPLVVPSFMRPMFREHVLNYYDNAKTLSQIINSHRYLKRPLDFNSMSSILYQFID